MAPWMFYGRPQHQRGRGRGASTSTQKYVGAKETGHSSDEWEMSQREKERLAALAKQKGQEW